MDHINVDTSPSEMTATGRGREGEGEGQGKVREGKRGGEGGEEGTHLSRPSRISQRFRHVLVCRHVSRGDTAYHIVHLFFESRWHFCVGL